MPTTTNISEDSETIVEPTANVEVHFTNAGFQVESGAQGYKPSASPPPPARGKPTPLPKRPKGRLFVGVMLLAISGLVGHSLWSAFLRHRAYGVVIGNVAQISAPWDGFVVESRSNESRTFKQSEVVAAVDSLELRHQIDQLADQLVMAQAELDAEVSRLRWESQEHIELGTRVAAEHFEAQGALASNQAFLERLTRDRKRAEQLADRQAISLEKRDATALAELGQREKVNQLQLGAALRSSRSSFINSLEDSGTDQLAPKLAAIGSLKNEMARLREVLEQGRLRSPFASVLITRSKLIGERVDAREPVVEVLQAGSLEIALYLSQKDADALKPGDTITVSVEPGPRDVPCTVQRIGQRLQEPPPSIERFYWSNEPLLCVFLKPNRAHDDWMSVRLGSVVRW